MYAVVRVRGTVGIDERVERTLKLLNLEKPNHCTIVPANESYKGMLQKVKDFVTWGEIDDDTLRLLVEKKGRKAGNKKLDEKEVQEVVEKIKKYGINKSGIKPVFRLAPPRKGYERGGVKKPYKVGGALGYRGKEINSLIRRMLGEA